jgi:dienelactone hydrolase
MCCYEDRNMKVAFSVSILAGMLSLLLLGASTKAAEPFDNTAIRKTTPDGVEYGLWGNTAAKSAPTLFMLAGTIESTLEKPYFRQCGNELAELGYVVVSIDIPCHGTQAAAGDCSGLGGWGHRVGRNEDFVAECNIRLSRVLDHLIDTGLTDPDRVAIGGTSRGGFLAIHFAAHDSRVKCAAAFAPVTDLAALSEFRDLQEHPFVQQLSLENQAEKLAGRPVWIVIGDRDERVSTQRSIDLATRLSAIAKERDVPSNVELHVMSEPRGHTTPQGSSSLAADWVHRQLSSNAERKTTASAIRDTDHEGTLPSSSDAGRIADGPTTLLLVDDHHVLYRAGTKRVFHPAMLNPTNPIIREDKPWEMAIGWTSVVRHAETGKYQLWYQAYAGGRDERKSHKCVVCVAESDDGITFTKPALGVHDFMMTREPMPGLHTKTNIVLVGDGGYGDRYANSVLFDPSDDDPSKHYRMLYTDFGKDADGREWPGFFAAFSPDGIHWKKSPQNPLIKTAYGGRSLQPQFSDEVPYDERWDARKNFLRKNWPIPLSMSDAADVFYDPNLAAWVVYGKSWLQGPDGGLAWKHAMARVESKDFINWSKPQIVASTDDLDPPNTEFHTSPVFFRDGCYFSLNQILIARGEAIGAKADAMHIELMISRDGFRWERPFRDEPFIENSKQSFSNGGIFTNSTPIYLDDEIRFYYGGYNSGAIGGGAKLTDASQQSGVGFASLGLNRFAGIRPVKISAQSTLKRPLDNIGQVTLKPLDLSDVRNISLNADASEGSICVEILNEDGYRVRGFSKDDAEPVTGDSLTHAVKWEEQNLKQLPAGQYLIRLHLDNAEVFAITLQ